MNEHAQKLRNLSEISRHGNGQYSSEGLILRAAADEIEVQERRADDNGRTCRMFAKALEGIQSSAIDILRMPWLFDAKEENE